MGWRLAATAGGHAASKQLIYTFTIHLDDRAGDATGVSARELQATGILLQWQLHINAIHKWLLVLRMSDQTTSTAGSSMDSRRGHRLFRAHSISASACTIVLKRAKVCQPSLSQIESRRRASRPSEWHQASPGRVINACDSGMDARERMAHRGRRWAGCCRRPPPVLLSPPVCRL